MGQDELVLKIPSEDSVDSSSDPSPKPPSPTKLIGGSSLVSANMSARISSSSKSNKSHSRESSGASVKFVNSPPHHMHHPHHLNHHRRNASKGSTESHVVILTPSEDLTVSDRLSPEDDDDEQSDLSEDDRLLPPSIEQDEVHGEQEDIGPIVNLRMLPADDSKIHGGNYGSFTDLNEHDPESEVNPNPRGASLPRGGAKSQSGGKSKGKGSSDKHSNNSPTDAIDERTRHRGTSDMNSRERSSVISNSGAYSQPTGASSVHDSCSSDDEAGRTNANGYVRRKSRHPKNSSVRIEVDGPVSIPESTNHPNNAEVSEIPCEPLKTLFSFVFLFLAWLATTTSLALTHERVPDIAPLPDIFLDNVQYQPWGLDASEIVIMIATMSAFALALFHQHRFIVFRRIFFLAGIHYFYRSVTFYVTVLPKADPTYKCAPKSEHLTFVVIAQRVLKLLGGMGLSINGRHVYCGDYIYSGHTMTLLMTYLVIQEYSPRRWFILRWISLATTVGGVITLLFARGHYSVDVIIAYWITTRLWWIYHTMADNQHVVHAENTTNRLTKFWWWYVFVYLEGNVRRPLPKGYSWPLPKQVQHVPGLIWSKIRGRGRGSDTEENNDAFPDNDPEAGRSSLSQAVSTEGRRSQGNGPGPGSSSASAASLR